MNGLLKKTAILSILILLNAPAFADEYTAVDNDYIHQYRGVLGKWVYIESKEALLANIQKFQTTLEDVNKINDTNAGRVSNNYIFIPYSAEYLDKLKEKGKDRTLVKSATNKFIWPTLGIGKITSVLGFRNKKFHPGLDIPAARGMPIVASMEGVVAFNGFAGGYGRTIVIKHRNNFLTRYTHNSANFVKAGEFVKKGQIIGLVGSTGNSTGNHIHFELRCNDIPLDPLDFLPPSADMQIIHTLKNWK